MQYDDLEREIKRYIRKSTYLAMSVDERHIYAKGVRRIMRKLSEATDRENYVELADKEQPQPSLGFMAVGMRFRGNHKFSVDDNISLELDDNNRVDKNAIKILVDGRHVAFVAAEDALKLRDVDDLLEREIHLVQTYAQSVKMQLGNVNKSRQKKGTHRERNNRRIDRIINEIAHMHV
jgi:hypothetical protein